MNRMNPSHRHWIRQFWTLQQKSLTATDQVNLDKLIEKICRIRPTRTAWAKQMILELAELKRIGVAPGRLAQLEQYIAFAKSRRRPNQKNLATLIPKT